MKPFLLSEVVPAMLAVREFIEGNGSRYFSGRGVIFVYCFVTCVLCMFSPAGLTKHIINVHDGHEGPFHRCLHDELPPHEWLDPGANTFTFLPMEIAF